MSNVEYPWFVSWLFFTFFLKNKKKKEKIRFSLDWANKNGDNNNNNNVIVI